ncbi:MAG: DNA (cytosine-5-)-methyltransferase [Prevotella sp.]|nr:DNA (cytosine-5-)-methyltransferase [Prevotella sp.]
MDKTVVELFAGVGGFRVGLNNVTKITKNGRALEKNNFKFVWFNQWEPSTKNQYAYECYIKRFPNSTNQTSNKDINKVDKNEIPDHTLLCGGFPCQDYSVARSLSKEKGIEGKKGVLWWQIKEILEIKKSPFVLLENVDRLIKSPSKQRGRDFAIMLRCFSDLDYSVEWRIINAADYGFPQKRRRLYIFAYKNNTAYANRLALKTEKEIFEHDGIFAKSFPVKTLVKADIFSVDLNTEYTDLVSITDNFSFKFRGNGYMKNGIVYTSEFEPVKWEPKYLKNILEMRDIADEYYLTEAEEKKFKFLRGKKSIPRISPVGQKYFYSEGSMSDVDSLDMPGRTMLTSEGSVNRSTHLILDPSTNKKRVLTPIECERLNQFPDNWTNTMPKNRRYFVMGNALVCGLITKLGAIISDIIDNEP